MTLLKETLDLLKATKESRPKISNNSGLGVHWIEKLAQGKIINPGVNDVEKLNLYLKDEAKRLK